MPPVYKVHACRLLAHWDDALDSGGESELQAGNDDSDVWRGSRRKAIQREEDQLENIGEINNGLNGRNTLASRQKLSQAEVWSCRLYWLEKAHAEHQRCVAYYHLNDVNLKRLGELGDLVEDDLEGVRGEAQELGIEMALREWEEDRDTGSD